MADYKSIKCIRFLSSYKIRLETTASPKVKPGYVLYFKNMHGGNSFNGFMKFKCQRQRKMARAF